jgi:hypothetical protein
VKVHGGCDALPSLFNVREGVVCSTDAASGPRVPDPVPPHTFPLVPACRPSVSDRSGPPQAIAGGVFPASRMPRSVSTMRSSAPPITKNPISAKIEGR